MLIETVRYYASGIGYLWLTVYVYSRVQLNFKATHKLDQWRCPDSRRKLTLLLRQGQARGSEVRDVVPPVLSNLQHHPHSTLEIIALQQCQNRLYGGASAQPCILQTLAANATQTGSKPNAETRGHCSRPSV
ncbi:hypothetical protein MUK42_36062 [Musa troglodytarum]|uniref:Uncharacterized protein n=1 Tax=Musa troglodytarum TaxID=320322 RepID=A0A9E7E9T2_9LILI|nr:hypothetical protein MUK42_36062 [Musa troglodytarum]